VHYKGAGDRKRSHSREAPCRPTPGHRHLWPCSQRQATPSLFLYEPGLGTHIAQFLQLGHGISTSVQTAAIVALDSIARYRVRIQEVPGTILMSLLRKTIADANNPQSESLYRRTVGVRHIPRTACNTITDAGLVPILVQIIGNKLAQRLQMVNNVLRAYAGAFQLFSNARCSSKRFRYEQSSSIYPRQVNLIDFLAPN
jgi:E3 ubiquitin-protein ligase HUWE1